MFDQKYQEGSYLSLTLTIEKITVDILLDYLHELAGIRQSSYTMHEHSAHEVYIIEQGEMTLECENLTLVLKQGDVFIVRAHTFHRIRTFSEDFRRFNLRFAVRGQDEGSLPPYLHSSGHGKDILQTVGCIRQIMQASESRFSFYRLQNQLGFLFSHILELMLPDTDPAVRNRAHTQYSRLNQYVRIDQYFFDHCAEPITLDTLAEHLSYSRPQTNRILHEYCGMSFREKLAETRIRLAKRCLSDGMSVEEAAYHCGYNTRQGFERMFRRYTGTTPSAYQRE